MRTATFLPTGVLILATWCLGRPELTWTQELDESSSLEANGSEVETRVVEAPKRTLVPLNELPRELRATISALHDQWIFLWSVYDRGGMSESYEVPDGVQVQAGKPWLAKPIDGIPKSGPGYCPLKVSYGAVQQRQEEQQISWPYTHSEDGIASVRNLGNFYALINPETGKYVTYRQDEYMKWDESITQAQINNLCQKALEDRGPRSYQPVNPNEPSKSYPSFLDHQPALVKRSCPGGGRDTFAATYGVFYLLKKLKVVAVNELGEELPESGRTSLICEVHTQICCFDSEAPWPLHSLYPQESGPGYDEGDPDYQPSEEEIGKPNYAYSLLGSRGLDLSRFAPADLVQPPQSNSTDVWLKRTAPILQPVFGQIPALSEAREVVAKEVVFTPDP